MSRPTSVSRRRLAVERLEDRTVPATFTVTSAADSGTNTLRWAIQQANATAAADTINFSPSVTSVTLNSALDQITKSVTIQGPANGLVSIQRNSATGTAKFRLLDI